MESTTTAEFEDEEHDGLEMLLTHYYQKAQGRGYVDWLTYYTWRLVQRSDIPDARKDLFLQAYRQAPLYSEEAFSLVAENMLRMMLKYGAWFTKNAFEAWSRLMDRYDEFGPLLTTEQAGHLKFLFQMLRRLVCVGKGDPFVRCLCECLDHQKELAKQCHGKQQPVILVLTDETSKLKQDIQDDSKKSTRTIVNKDALSATTASKAGELPQTVPADVRGDDTFLSFRLASGGQECLIRWTVERKLSISPQNLRQYIEVLPGKWVKHIIQLCGKSVFNALPPRHCANVDCSNQKQTEMQQVVQTTKTESHGQQDELLSCSRCQGVFYCNKMCQVHHWAVHKHDCSTLHRLLEERRRRGLMKSY